MSTRGWKQSRRCRTFPVTHSLGTNRVPFCTLKKTVFREIRPLMETFLECETMCREPPPGHVFVESLAEIDPRKVLEVVRHLRHKKTTPLRPIFSRSLQNPQRDFAGNVQGCLFRPQHHLPSFIQIRPSFRDLLAKMTFQIVTIYGDPIRSPITGIIPHFTSYTCTLLLSQKNKTTNSCPYFGQILTNFKNSYTGTHTQQEICNEAIIKDPTTHQMRHYFTHSVFV